MWASCSVAAPCPAWAGDSPCEAPLPSSPCAGGTASWEAPAVADVPWDAADPASGAGVITAACSIEAGAAGAFAMFATVAGFVISVWNHPFSTNGFLNQKENDRIARTTSGTHMFGCDSWAWSYL